MRFHLKAIASVLPVLLSACAPRTAPGRPLVTTSAKLMGPPEFKALPSKPADRRIAYGDDPNQFGDLRVPSSGGPHPVVILIHGGCWKAAYANLRDLAPMADALKADGIATWSVEYRRLGQSGSGWPGTYLDIGRAVDQLRSIADDYKLDLDRVVVLGHSAGGHLAMWVAARSRLPKGSPLYVEHPLAIRGVINPAGTGDMEAYISIEMRACREAVVEAMLGGKPADVPERYTQVSAIRMLPLGTRQVVIWGREDDFVPMWLAEKYEQAARQAGDPVRLVIVPGLGHFEIASPLSPAWPEVRSSIGSLLER